MEEIIKILIMLLVLGTSLFIGKFLARFCDDELKKDRKYMLGFIFLFLFLMLLSFLFYFKLELIFALGYITLTISIAVRIGRKKEFRRKKL